MAQAPAQILETALYADDLDAAGGAALRDAAEFGLIGLLKPTSGGDPDALVAPWGGDGRVSAQSATMPSLHPVPAAAPCLPRVWTVVLAAGAGTRLATVTQGTPKQFWRLDSQPTLLEHTLNRLSAMAPRVEHDPQRER